MSFTAALYEGDSVIRSTPRIRAPGTKHAAHPLTALESAELGSALLKGGMILVGAIWNAIRSVALWIDEKSREAHYQRIESYLAQSTDHADLERRLRDLERSNRLNWIDCGSR